MLTLTNRQREVYSRFNRISLARESFWHYCRAVDGTFYKPTHPHLVHLCTVLNNFFYGLPLDSTGRVYRDLIVNMPPRFGKTRTFVHWTDWILGRDNEQRIILGSYNDTVASDFSKYARDGIIKQKLDPDDIVFSDVFPNTRIKHGDSAQDKWALDGQHFNYLGCGPKGSVTSKGATVQIVDDPIKSAEDALNENVLDGSWLWYTSTFLSRIEPMGKMPLRVINMTRWAKKDICGRLLEIMPDSFYVLRMEAMNRETGEMLCPDFLTRPMYESIRLLMMEEIFMANYHQQPMDMLGKLYKSFKTYDELPKDDNGKSLIEQIRSYTDTADLGDNFLCSIVYGVYQKRAYVLDVYYTKDGMEQTEPETARRIYEHKVNIANIESNSGGRGFARNVERLLFEKHWSRSTYVKWFHQSENKNGRIMGQSANVMENVLFPRDWRVRWPEYYAAMNNFSKEGKNAYDDAPDATTGVAEALDERKIQFLK
jgi:predicted phage terminase large subunit-like protein